MRKLRLEGNNTNNNPVAETSEEVSDRKLRVANDEVLKKADRLLELKQLLAQRKSENKAIEDEIDILQGEIMDFGRENHLENLMSDTALVQFRPRVTRTIDPKEFLSFLHAHGKAKEFYNFCSVPITNAMKNFGEAVLASAGVLTCQSREYADLKVSARK